MHKTFGSLCCLARLQVQHDISLQQIRSWCLQTGASDFGAVAEIDFDSEASTSGYDAFADLVQMAVREDPSLASVASTSGNQEPAGALHSWKLDFSCFCVHTYARSLSDSALRACSAGKRCAL